MFTELIILFTGLSLLNVIWSTVRSILTVKGGIFAAALASSTYFSFYNIVMQYTVSDDISMPIKCTITLLCNFVGVALVKWGEKKREKNKTWLVKMTIPDRYHEQVKMELKEKGISRTMFDLGKWKVFDCYCNTKAETKIAMAICNRFDGKGISFASENVF